MDLNKLNNYDLLCFHHTETSKLKSFCNRTLNTEREVETTFNNVIRSGIIVIDRFYNTLKSSSSLKFLKSIDVHLLNVAKWQFSGILKSLRLCLEALIWLVEQSDDSSFSNIFSNIYNLIGSLCKVLIFQGDFLELCVSMEKLIICGSNNEEFNELREKFSYIFDLLKNWGVYEASNISVENFNKSKLKRNDFRKEVRIKILNSYLTGNITYQAIDYILNAFKDLNHSDFIVDFPKTEYKDGKFNFIKKMDIIRLFIGEINYDVYHSRRFCSKKTSSVKKSIHDVYYKLNETVINISNKNESNILYVLEVVYDRLSIGLDIRIGEYEDIFELILSELNKTHSINKVVDKRKRSKNVAETINSGINPENYELKNIELEPSLIILNILNNSIKVSSYNDKQHKTWMQTIPFYCYNLILSIMERDQMRCDDFFSLNLTSNFPSVNQFDELIMNEVFKLDLINNSESGDFLGCEPSGVKELSKDSKLFVQELFSLAKNSKTEFNFSNIDKTLSIIVNYLLNLNLLVNKFNVYDNKSDLIKKIIGVIHIHLEYLFSYCTGLIEYVIFSKIEEHYRGNKFNTGSAKPKIFFKSYKSIYTWGHFAYELIKLYYEETEVVILSFLHTLLRTLLSFNVVISNLLNYSLDNDILTFYQIIERDFVLVLDSYTIYKEKFAVLNLEDTYPVRILYVLFILTKIRRLKFYYENTFRITYEGSIGNLRKYTKIIKIVVDYSDAHDNRGYSDENKDSDNDISLSQCMFSNHNLNKIFERLTTWSLLVNMDNNFAFFSNESIQKCLKFIDYSFFEYILNIKAESFSEINHRISYNSLLHNINYFLEVFLTIHQRHLNNSSSRINFSKEASLVINITVEILRNEVQILLLNSTLLISIIGNLIKFFSILTRNKDNLTFDIYVGHLKNVNIFIISKIHNLFVFYLTNNKINLLLIRCLMTLLLVMFDFYQEITSFTVSPVTTINLFKYLVHLEFAFSLLKNENGDSKPSNEHECVLKHFLSNYCSFYQLIDYDEIINMHEYSISHSIIEDALTLILELTNVRPRLFFSFIKYGLVYHLSRSIHNWFLEINSFIREYKMNPYQKNVNSLFLECRKICMEFSRFIDVSNYNVTNNDARSESNEHKSLFVSPEQETDYLELFGILIQFIYGIPVCPLPSEPFNKLPVHNQILIFSRIKSMYFCNQIGYNIDNCAVNILSVINYLISKKINAENSELEIFGYLTPNSPLLSLCCNLFDSLISCTSLTEKQYSDSKVSFYSSFVGLIEERFFYSKFNNESSATIESEFFWNIISSPVIFPAFMEPIYSESTNKNELLVDPKATNSTILSDLSSLLFNDCISDAILNFYDNIFVLKTDFIFEEIKCDSQSILQTSPDSDLILGSLLLYQENPKKMFIISPESILLSKYYLARFLDEFMVSNLDPNFLKDERLYSVSLNILNTKIRKYMGNENILENVISYNIILNKKKYIPLNFLAKCFVSCIPSMFKYRNSSSWCAGKFGNSYCSSIFHGGTSSNSKKNINTLFVYLKWLNMNLFLINYFEIQIITATISILKLLVSEYDDLDSLELRSYNEDYSYLLRRMISQTILLLEIENRYYLNLFSVRKSDIGYSFGDIDLLFAINYDNMCVRMVNVKGAYPNINIKYLLLKGYISNEEYEGLGIKYFDDKLLLNCIASITDFREKMFTIFFPFLSSSGIEWLSIHSTHFDKINGAIWLPSYLESKCRFKLAKIQIYSYIFDAKIHYNKLDEAVKQIITAYSLSIESLLFCYLSLFGIPDEINSFLECATDFLKDNSSMCLINFFKKKSLLIYKTINDIFLNKFPSHHPLFKEINLSKKPSLLQSSHTSNNNVINHLHYFYRSFINIQSIKQFAILLINAKQIKLGEGSVEILLDAIAYNSIDKGKINNEITKKLLINELIFDDINENQSIIKKNKLVQMSLSPYIYQLNSYFSIINFILLNKSPLELILYYQKAFPSNKKVIPFYGVDNSRLSNDHYNGLYLRRNRKHINSKLKFLDILAFIFLTTKREIYSNLNSIKTEIMNSEVFINSKSRCISLDDLGKDYIGICFCIYFSLLKNDFSITNIPQRFMDIKYHYMETINLVFDQLLDIIYNEIKSIRQLPTIETFEYEILDKIKSINKKGFQLEIPVSKLVRWEDVCEHGKFNISLMVIRNCFLKIKELFSLVISLNLPTDGGFFSNVFVLVFLFYKYDIHLSQGAEKSKSELLIKNVNNISQAVLKQLEKHFGYVILCSIPFSLIDDLIFMKPIVEETFLVLFNKNFLFTTNMQIKSAKLNIIDLINLILESIGMNSIFNNFRSSQNFKNKTNLATDIIKLEDTNPKKKRKFEELTLFSINEGNS